MPSESTPEAPAFQRAMGRALLVSSASASILAGAQGLADDGPAAGRRRPAIAHALETFAKPLPPPRGKIEIGVSRPPRPWIPASAGMVWRTCNKSLFPLPGGRLRWRQAEGGNPSPATVIPAKAGIQGRGGTDHSCEGRNPGSGGQRFPVPNGAPPADVVYFPHALISTHRALPRRQAASH